ncbi:MAG: diaminopimelate epimerase [Clostridia bacterium]|nr:diaminopimelate epimerase [Clostridia bacterium]
MKFTKMHGIGNDYVLVNRIQEPILDPRALSVRMCQRHTGIGADGLVLLESSSAADFTMRIFNADGSESESCGNALRCIAGYIRSKKLTGKTEFSLETGSGIRGISILSGDDEAYRIRVDMGEPVLTPDKIPVKLPGDRVLGYTLRMDGRLYTISAVGMGNPHCIVFTDDPDWIDVQTIGLLIENHALFPNKTNVEFMKVVDRGHIRLRVWERGVGETMACGTGACAAMVAAFLSGRVDTTVVAHLRGGSLLVEWNLQNNHVCQTGAAEHVFNGDWPDDTIAG